MFTLTIENSMSHGQVSGLSPRRLRCENYIYRGTAGVSCNNAEAGFVPAFLDPASGRVYRSRFANGEYAPFHLLDGLPEHLLRRSPLDGSILSVVPGLKSGFTRNGLYYSRAEAAAAVQRTGVNAL